MRMVMEGWMCPNAAWFVRRSRSAAEKNRASVRVRMRFRTAARARKVPKRAFAIGAGEVLTRATSGTGASGALRPASGAAANVGNSGNAHSVPSGCYAQVASASIGRRTGESTGASAPCGELTLAGFARKLSQPTPWSVIGCGSSSAPSKPRKRCLDGVVRFALGPIRERGLQLAPGLA